MKLQGERIRRTRLVHTDDLVVAVEIEMVIPIDDPGEPCLEAETVQFLKEVTEHAQRRDVDWLKQHGRVYALVNAA